MADHGTYARAQKHYRDEGAGWVCVPCREALRTRHNTTNEALAILRDRHRGEYLRILNTLQEANDEEHV